MTATVYHATYDPRTRSGRDLAFQLAMRPSEEDIRKAVYDGILTYVRVAELPDTNDVSTAFRLTNHIDEDWTMNKGVNAVGDGTVLRSTSAGDIIEINGTFYLCAGIGMEILKKFNAQHHVDVNEALDNAHENGYPSTGNYDVALDLIQHCQPLENVEDPGSLDVHIQGWRHRRLGRDLNQAVKDAQS